MPASNPSGINDKFALRNAAMPDRSNVRVFPSACFITRLFPVSAEMMP